MAVASEHSLVDLYYVVTLAHKQLHVVLESFEVFRLLLHALELAWMANSMSELLLGDAVDLVNLAEGVGRDLGTTTLAELLSTCLQSQASLAVERAPVNGPLHCLGTQLVPNTLPLASLAPAEGLDGLGTALLVSLENAPDSSDSCS